MTRRALVTGAEGFVGCHLRVRLADAGYEIFSGTAGPYPSISNNRAFDLCDSASVEALVAWAAPVECVVHLAAITFVPDSARSPERVMDVNLGGTIRLLDAVRRHAPNARVLFIGSSEAYGPPLALPIDEAHPLAPANPYAIAKAAADHYCAYAHAASGMDIVRARPFNHSGPGQAPDFVLSSFAKQIVEMEAGARGPVLHVGNLDVARDFSHVSDVVDAYTLLLQAGRSGEAYNVCSNRAVPLRNLVDHLRSLTSVDVEVRSDPGRVRASDVTEIRGSHDKITRETGWQPRRDVNSIVEDVLDFWRGRARN